MRVRVHEANLVDDLVGFLRRCECRVVQVDLETIDVELDVDVSLDAAMSLVRAGRCYRCGEEVAPTLSALGSALCHDCRDRDEEPSVAHRGMRRRLWAQMEIDAYLKVWRALHPEVCVSFSDGPGWAGKPAGDRLGSSHSNNEPSLHDTASAVDATRRPAPFGELS